MCLLIPLALNFPSRCRSSLIVASTSRRMFGPCRGFSRIRRLPKSLATSSSSISSRVMSNSSSIHVPTKHIVHCNHAGASPSPSSVLSTVVEHLQLEQTMGGYTAADMANDKLQSVYDQISQQLLGLNRGSNTNSRHEIALVESATVAWTRLFYSMADYQHQRRQRRQQKISSKNSTPAQSLSKRLVILVSEAEYAANVVAACQWAKDHQQQQQQQQQQSPSWTVLSLPSTRTQDGRSTGKVDLPILEEMLQGKYQYQPGQGHCNDGFDNEDSVTLDPSNIAMVCVAHIPTNCGIVNDIEGIGKLIANYNNNKGQKFNNDNIATDNNNNNNNNKMPSILYLVDACQSIGQRQVDVPQVQCHGLVATGRKFLRGPRGTGFLYVPYTVANQLQPHHMDHFGVPVAAVPSIKNDNLPVEELIRFQPKPGASRFEFYESNVANKLGLGEAIRYAVKDVGIHTIQSATTTLAQDLYQRLQAMESVQTHHPPECGIVTFFVPNVSSKTIKALLWDNNDDTDGIQFETSLVPATSTPLDSSNTGVPDMVRVSLTYTNSKKDLDALCEKLSSILSNV